MQVTIYLPDEIGKAAKDKNLKMSRICRAAVERELAKRAQEANELSTDIDAVAARLRASKYEEYERDYDEGYALGVRWAKEKASFSSLKWFAEQADRRGSSVFLNESLLSFLGSQYGTDQYGELNIFWDFLQDAERTGDPAPRMQKDRDDGFYAGLLAGASEVWLLVQPKLTDD